MEDESTTMISIAISIARPRAYVRARTCAGLRGTAEWNDLKDNQRDVLFS